MIHADRQRLAGILGMLGSNSAGERDNAARLAEQFRRTSGLTWIELLTPPVKLLIVPGKPAAAPPAAQPAPVQPAPPPWTPPPNREWMKVCALAAFWIGGLVAAFWPWASRP